MRFSSLLPASAVVLFIVIGVFFMGDPALTGLATLDFHQVSIDINKKFIETSSFPVELITPAYRVHASGYVEGTGDILIRLLEGSTSYVLYNESLRGAGVRFTSCSELCSYDILSSHAVIDVQLDDNVVLYLDNLTYLSDTTNKAPVLAGPSPAFRLQKNEGITLDLSRFIMDPDGDEVTFVALAEGPFAVELFGDQLHISPEFGYIGDGIIKVFASDYEHTTPIELPLQVVSSSPEDMIPVPLYQHSICGNGVCQRFEDSKNCPQDCGVLPLGSADSSFSLTAAAWLFLGLALLFFILGKSGHHTQGHVRTSPKKKSRKRTTSRKKKAKKRTTSRKKKR